MNFKNFLVQMSGKEQPLFCIICIIKFTLAEMCNYLLILVNSKPNSHTNLSFFTLVILPDVSVIKHKICGVLNVNKLKSINIIALMSFSLALPHWRTILSCAGLC